MAECSSVKERSCQIKQSSKFMCMCNLYSMYPLRPNLRAASSVRLSSFVIGRVEALFLVLPLYFASTFFIVLNKLPWNLLFTCQSVSVRHQTP